MTPYSPTSNKPSVKSKPANLQGSPLSSPEQDYLHDNLLDSFDDNSEPIRLPTTQNRNSSETPSLSLPDGSSRLIIAIDYGTTFTGVAFATPSSDHASLDDIEIVMQWGPKQPGNHHKIPSVLSYSPATAAGEEQWGASLSPDALTMVNTKMELDLKESKQDELDLILQVLDGVSNLDFDAVKKSRGLPEYTWKNPEEIVTDYLTKVFEHVNKNSFQNFSSHLLSQLQVDIVITVPVKWSYQAKNSTFRAIKNAGFSELTYPNLSNIILVTEPEAAAIYTARYLKEDKKTEFLKIGECFILCDAGGGTVDVVSYKVTRLEPTLELEQITIATSDKCGSSFIDAKFKSWLRSILGERHYRILDPRGGRQITEGREMRELMSAFDSRKKTFSSDVPQVNFYIPKCDLWKLNIAGKLEKGNLTISNEEMKAIFDPCVDAVVTLIQGQIAQAAMHKYRVRNVFLVGGFGESPYLQEELKKSLKLRKITLRRPDLAKAWTAVVQGAVIYGIEKSLHNNITTLTPCPRSYGVALSEEYSVRKYDSDDRYVDTRTNKDMAKRQMTWLIRRGDLILSDAKKEFEKDFRFHISESGARKFTFPVYEYPDDDDDVPDRFEIGQHDLREAALLVCDLSSIPLTEFEKFKNPKTLRPFYTALLTCKFVLSGSSIEVGIHWNERTLCSTKIADVETESIKS